MNMDAIKQRINDKILALMADVITEEELNAMVIAAVDKFFGRTSNGDEFDVNIREDRMVRGAKVAFKVSPFELMVWELVHPIAYAAIKQVFENGKNALQTHAQEIIDAKIDSERPKILALATDLQQLQCLGAIGNAMQLISMHSMTAVNAMARGDTSAAIHSMASISAPPNRQY